jgi:hypothetical protein
MRFHLQMQENILEFDDFEKNQLGSWHLIEETFYEIRCILLNSNYPLKIWLSTTRKLTCYWCIFSHCLRCGTSNWVPKTEHESYNQPIKKCNKKIRKRKTECESYNQPIKKRKKQRKKERTETDYARNHDNMMEIKHNDINNQINCLPRQKIKMSTPAFSTFRIRFLYSVCNLYFFLHSILLPY